jgi:hypothetical protein
LERLRIFYQDKAQDRIFATMQVPSKALAGFAAKHPPGVCSCPDLKERVEYWDEFLHERLAVHDDSIPAAYLSEMDQGLYGGIVGGKVQFLSHPEKGAMSSMVWPILQDWSGFRQLSIDHESEWYQLYLRELELFREKAYGRFGISHLILINGLNFVFELFGASRTYLELYDNPEMVRQAIGFSYRLNLDVQQTFFECVGLLDGGTCSNMGEWLPGHIVSESVDPFHMTSVRCFEKWGREPAEHMLQTFDGGIVHIHANGRHLLEAVSSLGGLKMIFALDDRCFPSSFSIVREIKQRIGSVPLVVNAEYTEFNDALHAHRLPGGLLFKVKNVPSSDDANRCMERVQSYRIWS